MPQTPAATSANSRESQELPPFQGSSSAADSHLRLPPPDPSIEKSDPQNGALCPACLSGHPEECDLEHCAAWHGPISPEAIAPGSKFPAIVVGVCLLGAVAVAAVAWCCR